MYFLRQCILNYASVVIFTVAIFLNSRWRPLATVSHELGKRHSWLQVNKLSLNIAKTNFMIFVNKQFEDNHVVSINGMNIKRVYVTKCIGVHIDSHLNWCGHINHIKSKISKNVSLMRRVTYLFIDSALYSLYSTLVMPYLNYCCEIWGNTCKSQLQPLHIILKRAILFAKRLILGLILDHFSTN